MICILKIENGEPTGWIIATDVDDARRQAYGAGEGELANLLYTVYDVAPGKHELPTGHTMLVS